MFKITCYIFCFCFSVCSYAQKKKPAFCGVRYTDTAVLRHQYEQQLKFLHINDNDTIVDIGAASGVMEGALNVIAAYSNVHFLLVDIDTFCLNPVRVQNMASYYGSLSGRTSTTKYTIVNNSPDSLYLPANSYRKAWLMNTLHEIPDKQKMIRDIAAILKPGGELVMLEILSRPGHTIHGGCNQPLLDENEIRALLEQNGFEQKETLWNPTSSESKKTRNPYYMVRFVKK
jgi:ubiquinone/menaquinone biosynthesis C-methylase UbiE